MKKEISFFGTYIDRSATETIESVLHLTFLSEGELVKEFESRLSNKLGIINPVAVNSGTSALHLALILADIKPGDEVICPPQTFIATGMAILYCGATPVFADIQYETGNIDPKSIEKKITRKTKAILPVHWGGYPCDLDEILALAMKYKLVVIEDAAHALGAKYKNKPIGSISPFTCFSFQAIKHLTTGDGGAVCCLSNRKAKEAHNLRWFGIDRVNSQPSILGERIFDIDRIGFKYHLNDYAAALGLANLVSFKKRLERRRKIVARYRKELNRLPGISLFKYETDRESANWLFGLHVDRRADFIKALKSRGIPTSVVHQRIDRFKILGSTREDLVNQTRFDETKIHIPLHDQLDDKQVTQIIESIKKGW